MGDHGPETAQGERRDTQAQLRYVTLQKGPDKPLAPLEGRLVIRGEEGARKTAPVPKRVLGRRANLAEIEAAEIDKPDPARQRFGNALDQGGGGTPQDQKACPGLGPIHQHPQDLEQARLALNFIDDHQPFQVAEGAQG